MNDLNTLKNIGNASAFWLQTVGINNYDELKNVGIIEAYIRIHEFGIKTSKALLYSLYGAIHDIAWKDIDSKIKKQLCDDVEREMKNRHARTHSL